MDDFLQLIEDGKRRRREDAARYEALDLDECQLCVACGDNMRSLTINCLYAIHEVIPEAIDLNDVLGVGPGYYLRICKACRGALLSVLGAWRDARVAQRGIPKDHDGCDVVDDPDRNIHVRVNGATVMMSMDEYEFHRGIIREP